MLVKEVEAAVGEALSALVRSRAYASYQGDCNAQLIKELINTLSSTHCSLFSSGSSAMEVGLRACGVGSGDLVLVSGYDYPGNFWAIERCGAIPVLLDTEPRSWNLDAPKLVEVLDKLESAEGRGPVKALIVSHLHGQLQNIGVLRDALADRPIAILEDACQAIGAQVPSLADSEKTVPVGVSAEALIVSFGGGKVLSAGRGGALLTRSDSIAQKAKLAAGAGSGPYAMSELQAATVLAQLPFLKRINETSRSFFAKVQEEIQTLELELGSQWTWECPVDFSSTESHTSIYQMGWIRQSGKTLGTAVPVLQSERDGFSGGGGFSGFHRRSSRRCLKPVALDQVPILAQDTLVIHHSVALEGRTIPQQVAERLFGLAANP